MKRKKNMYYISACGFSRVTEILARLHLFNDLIVLHAISDTRFVRLAQYACRRTFTVLFPS